MRALDVADFLGVPLHGSDCQVVGARALYDREENTLVFSVDDLTDELMDLRHVCFITSTLPKNMGFNAFIIVDNPKLAFAKVAGNFFAKSRDRTIGESVIHPMAKVGKSIPIGNGCTIGSSVVIGKGTVVRNNVVIADGVAIGENCLIMSNSVIGEDGFNFAHDDDGIPIRVPHFGSVDIGDHVEIGNGCTVDRGVFNNTIVHSHVKIDNLVHVAHNCVIGEGTQIAACAEISGSCIIGERCWLGAGCSIRQKIQVGDDCQIGIGAVVVDDVPKGITVVGNPAKALKTSKKERAK